LGKGGNGALRHNAARLEAIISIVVNLSLAGLTLFFALRLSSLALMAQAAHTASDVLSSVVVLVGSWVAVRPADQEHPYGHGRAESIATLAIAMLLALVGLEFIRGGISRLMQPEPVEGSWLVAGFMVGAALVKEALARYAIAVGTRINSSAVKADGHHHRADALAALLAGAAIIGVEVGWLWLDGLLGIAIALIILKTAYSLGSEAGSVLLGRRPKAETIRRIEQVAMSVAGVEEVHRVSVHEYGQQRVVSLHVLVDPDMPVTAAHQIAETIEVALNRDLAAETTVHMEPNHPGQSLRADKRNDPDH
jgi:cation diffusion facilitator family transporter